MKNLYVALVFIAFYFFVAFICTYFDSAWFLLLLLVQPTYESGRREENKD